MPNDITGKKEVSQSEHLNQQLYRSALNNELKKLASVALSKELQNLPEAALVKAAQLGPKIAEIDRALNSAREIQRLFSALNVGDVMREQGANYLLETEAGDMDSPADSQTYNPIDSAQDLGALIKQKRKELGVKQNDLASLAGVSGGTVKAMESGANVSIENVLAISKVLGIKLYAD